MTKERFLRCKNSLLATYQSDLCEESLTAIEAANSPEELVRLLHEFATFLRYKALPTAKWCRTWFGKEQDLINACGVYLDQVVALTDPTEPSIMLIGNSKGTFIFTKPKRWSITLQDESECNLLAYGTAVVSVREKGSGKTEIINKDRHSVIKVHKI